LYLLKVSKRLEGNPFSLVGRGEIPAAGTHVEVSGQMIEILQTQDRGVKVVKLLAPVGRVPSAPLQSHEGQASSTG